jgi:RHS repeat-associated protein
VTVKTRYEPYGATAAGTAPKGIGFTGHVNDLDIGLVYMQQRYYDPIAGRFLSVDPVTTDLKTGSSFNRYVYVENNPFGNVDPTGMEAEGFQKGDTLDWKVNGMPRDVAGVVAAGRNAGMQIAGAVGDVITGLGTLNALLTPPGTENAYQGTLPVAGPVAKSATTVIGRVKDLKTLGAGEKSLLDRLPNRGNPKANWQQNAGVLREEMRLGKPIGDASPGDTAGRFLNAERNLLRDRGWTFDPKTNYWNPPAKP